MARRDREQEREARDQREAREDQADQQEREQRMPAAHAREMAKEELTRWQRLVEVLTSAAVYEDEAGDTERKLATLRQTVEATEAECAQRIAAAQTRATEAEAAADAKLDALATAQQLAEVSAREHGVDLQDQIDALQAELIQIERDRDAAKSAIVTEVAALRAERDELVGHLAALKARFAA